MANTPETKVKIQLKALLDSYGVLQYPIYPSMYNKRGYWDKQCWAPDGTGFVIESKKPGGKLSPFQESWKLDYIKWNIPHFIYDGSVELQTPLEEFLKLHGVKK